jgi:hypothetical protein
MPIDPTPARRLAVLASVAALAALGLLLHGPIVQWDGYHAFADAAPWLGLPNAANVLSNAPFAVVGWLGSRALARADAASRRAWRTVAVAVALTAIGSSVYHWAPDDRSLVLDRLPIAAACAGIACALLAERVDARWAAPPAVAAAVAVAAGSVGWAWTGDLRPYAFVQFVPLLLALVVLLARWRARDPAAGVGDGAWWLALGLYAAAKACEAGDHAIHAALAPLSGHVLKHGLAAAAAAVLLRAAARPQPGSSGSA